MIAEHDLELLKRSWLRSFASYSANNSLKNNDDNDVLFEKLLKSYSEPQRYYHTLQHLIECIQKFELVMHQTNSPRVIEVALWFHDSIYDVKGHDNEALSAKWAKESLCTVGAIIDEIEQIVHLIMVTQHSNIPKTIDEQTLVDIDLSILGACKERYDEYDIQVRKEYAWVPDDIYRVKRREVLETFLARPFIYSTPYFQEHFEVQARESLKRSITKLK